MPRVMPVGTYCDGMAMPPKGLGNNPERADSDLPQERVIRRQAAQLINQAHAATPVTVLFYAHNPSPRLRWSITVGFELDPAAQVVPFTAGTGPTWQMRAIRLPASGGAPADLNDIFINAAGVATARALPDGYELDSAVKDVRGTLSLFDGAGGTIDSGQFGNLVIEARWEPHDGAVDRKDIAQLLQRADLYIIGNAPQLSNGT